MNDKNLYQQKKQAQLDEWKAEFNRYKAKASGSSAEAQLKMNKQIKILEGKINLGKTKLEEISKSTAETFESMKVYLSDRIFEPVSTLTGDQNDHGNYCKFAQTPQWEANIYVRAEINDSARMGKKWFKCSRVLP